ncbi:XAC0095 family protein [Noviluteimonas gilva]|uniref:XAC0095-like domain-containing protein n=1 Tax=Noviluteimonas gilva TaxID=2682097 RepID=A0A7C9LMX7_9GAMM|nr:hypothetical protein [Lysobacter gilvus]MUV14123.1 hypothetical protein [Lysobacter gilvus]
MQDAARPQRPLAVYVLPERSHLELVELREYMRVMGRLAEPGTSAASGYDKSLRPHSFAWVFKRVERSIGRVLKTVYWSAEIQERALK